MIYFGLNEDDKTKIEHVAIVHSYDEYTPDDFLSTEDYTIIYTTTSKFNIANWLADFDSLIDDAEVLEVV